MNGRASITHPSHVPCGVLILHTDDVRPGNDRTAGEVRDGEGHFASRAQEGRTGVVHDSNAPQVSAGVVQSPAPAPVLLPEVTGGAQVVGAGWPLVNYLRLGALPLAVPCARLQVKVLLIEWELTELSEPAELCAAELVSNAVKAVNAMDPALRQPIDLRVSSDRAQILIEVWDCSPDFPVKPEAHGKELPGLDLESGRGLFLVESYSECWDIYPTAQYGGKVVWCRVAMEGLRI